MLVLLCVTLPLSYSYRFQSRCSFVLLCSFFLHPDQSFTEGKGREWPERRIYPHISYIWDMGNIWVRWLPFFSLLVIPQVCRIGLFVTRCYCFQCGGCLTFFKTVINPQTRHADACLTFPDSGGSGWRLKVVFRIGKSRLLETQTSKRGEKRQTTILINPRTWPSMVINPPMHWSSLPIFLRFIFINFDYMICVHVAVCTWLQMVSWAETLDSQKLELQTVLSCLPYVGAGTEHRSSRIAASALNLWAISSASPPPTIFNPVSLLTIPLSLILFFYHLDLKIYLSSLCVPK